MNGRGGSITTSIYLTKCLEIGFNLKDLELISVGMVIDLITTSLNKSEKGVKVATQEDFDMW